MGGAPWSNKELEALSESTFIDGSSPSARTAQMILAGISSASLKPGQKLPSERTLADDLNVGRSAVREALAALEILGVVEVIPGSGTYVRSVTSEVLPKTLSWGLLLKQDAVDELVGVREALEVYVAQRVAALGSDVDLTELERSVASQGEAMRKGDSLAYVRADQAFHVELSRLCDNKVLAHIVSTVRGLLRVWIERQVSERGDMEAALTEHIAVLDAIRQGDPVAARVAMRDHMVTAASRLSGLSTD